MNRHPLWRRLPPPHLHLPLGSFVEAIVAELLLELAEGTAFHPPGTTVAHQTHHLADVTTLIRTTCGTTGIFTILIVQFHRPSLGLSAIYRNYLIHVYMSRKKPLMRFFVYLILIELMFIIHPATPPTASSPFYSPSLVHLPQHAQIDLHDVRCANVEHLILLNGSFVQTEFQLGS